MQVLRTLMLTVFCLAACVPFASAQGIKIMKNEHHGTVLGMAQVVRTSPHFLRDTLTNLMNNKRAKLENDIKAKLGAADQIGRGWTLHHINLRIGQPTVRFTSEHGFEMKIPNNYLYARSTTPSVFGSYADPAFEIHFDLRVTGTLSLPSRTQKKIVVTNAVAEVPWISVKGRNVTGGAIVTAAKVFARNQIQKQANQYLRRDVTVTVNNNLASFNNAIAPLFSVPNTDVVTGLDVPNQLLVVTLIHNL